MTRDRDSTTIQAAAYHARMEQDYGRDPDRPTRAEAERDDERDHAQGESDAAHDARLAARDHADEHTTLPAAPEAATYPPPRGLSSPPGGRQDLPGEHACPHARPLNTDETRSYEHIYGRAHPFNTTAGRAQTRPAR